MRPSPYATWLSKDGQQALRRPGVVDGEVGRFREVGTALHRPDGVAAVVAAPEDVRAAVVVEIGYSADLPGLIRRIDLLLRRRRPNGERVQAPEPDPQAAVV